MNNPSPIHLPSSPSSLPFLLPPSSYPLPLSFPPPPSSRPLPSWYDEAKIGIFVHWGVFSVPSYGGGRSAGEWFWANWIERREPWIVKFVERNFLEGFTYPEFGPLFQAELFQPEEWAKLFEKSGARCVGCGGVECCGGFFLIFSSLQLSLPPSLLFPT